MGPPPTEIPPTSQERLMSAGSFAEGRKKNTEKRKQKKGMGQQESYEIPEYWEDELALSAEERKARYHCKPDQVVNVAAIPHWGTMAEETLEEGTLTIF